MNREPGVADWPVADVDERHPIGSSSAHTLAGECVSAVQAVRFQGAVGTAECAAPAVTAAAPTGPGGRP